MCYEAQENIIINHEFTGIKKTYTYTIIVIYYIITLFYKYLYVIIYAPATLLVFHGTWGFFRSRMCVLRMQILLFQSHPVNPLPQYFIIYHKQY